MSAIHVMCSFADLLNWIHNCNPGNVLACPSVIGKLAEAVKLDPGRPRWGRNWRPWLDSQDWDKWIAPLVNEHDSPI